MRNLQQCIRNQYYWNVTYFLTIWKIYLHGILICYKLQYLSLNAFLIYFLAVARIMQIKFSITINLLIKNTVFLPKNPIIKTLHALQ